ncbi:MAG TPA: 2-hydroxyacid dehydrogenase [Abditibacteriaceae bacterium]|nr:2-hydroxyacid dehydrogenase [Abditibacteriaceae bacterium]
MNVAVFSTKPYDREFLRAANTSQQDASQHELTFFEPRLTRETASLAQGFQSVCVFVHDALDRETLEILHKGGCRLVALRCAGFNNVDLAAAKELEIGVVRVPAYSPYAVAEHAAGLILTLNRKFYRAYNRVREGNFALEGLLGFDLHGKTVGVVGTGRIGLCFIKIMLGFGCRVLVFDPKPNDELKTLAVECVAMEQLLRESDIVSLHCPLTDATHHLMNDETLSAMKRGAMLVNTSRGGLVDAPAVVEALKSGQLGALGLDVYEEEEGVFYEDHSGRIIGDDVLLRLLSFPNVVVTGHQAFFTREALENIAGTTIGNLSEWQESGACKNAVQA